MKRLISIITLITVTFMLVVCINTESLATTQESTINLSITGKYGQTEARSMLKMVNNFRTGNDAWCWNSDNTKKEKYTNLKTLTYDYTLEKIAMKRAAEIALVWGHTRPNGESCFTAYEDSASSYYLRGENIAAGQSTAKSAFVCWQETNYKYEGQGHRRNMLSSGCTSIGIGHFYYNGIHYWVQELGYTTTKTSKTTANDKSTTVGIDILSSKIKGYSVTMPASSYQVNVNSTKAVPTIKTYATISEAWPTSKCPINENYTWKVANTSYATVSGNKIKGLKVGKTTLTTTAHGKKATVTLTVIPKKVTGLAAKSQTKTKIKLRWDKVQNASGYKIYKYNPKTKKYVKLGSTKGNTYNVKKLKAGTTYSFKVVAYQNVNGKKYIGTYSNVLKTSTKTKTPTVTKLTSKNKKATVQWKKVSGASGYQIYMSKTKNGKYTKVKRVSKKTLKYTKSNLKKNQKYYFKVRAYKTINGERVYSSFSQIKSVKIK